MTFMRTATEQVLDKAPYVTYGGGGITVVGGITLSDIGVAVGIAVGLVGIVLQVYNTIVTSSHANEKRKEERALFEAQMRELSKR